MILSKLNQYAFLLLLSPGAMLRASPYDPVDISQLFPESYTETVIVFQAPSENDPETTHPYVISDYDGNTVSEGEADVDGQGQLEITVDLPEGYYEIAFEGAQIGRETGLWCRPSAPSVDDGFMSIDTAISWLTKPAHRPALIANLPTVIRSEGMARERLSWNQINPEEGVWDWETYRQYATTRARYKAQGIAVLEMFHSAPKWLGAAQNGTFPDNLIATADAWRVISQQWSETWGALEVWNEPDIRFGGEQPSDQYVPIVKTVRYALRSEGVETPIGGGVFSAMNPEYANLAASNGLLDVSDFLSFHYYEDPLGLEDVVKQYRDWMDDFGYGSKPLWMTEVGLARAAYEGRAPLESQAEMALVYAMQAVEARACGIERFFPFVYVDYSERNGSRCYGMQDDRGTPLRILAASSQAGYALAGAEYIGDIPTDLIPGAKRIRVFKVEEDKLLARPKLAMVVIYTGDRLSGAEADLPFAAIEAVGIDGRQLSLYDDGRKVSVEDGLAYVYVAEEEIEGLLDSDTQAMALYRMAHGKQRALPAASSIVLQPQLAVDALPAVSSSGYFLPADCVELPLTVMVNNLGDEVRTVHLQVTGASESVVTVEGNSRMPASFNVDIRKLSKDPVTNKCRVLVQATSNSSEQILPVELILIPPSGLSEHLQGSSYQFELSLNEAYRWDNQANGDLTLQHDPGAAYGFRVKFNPGVDRWAYPVYSLPQEVDQNKIDGVLVRARCLKPAIVRMLSWDGHDNMSMTRYSIIPADGEWHVAYIPLDTLTQREFHAGDSGGADSIKLSKVAIGFNSETDENGLEISDLYLIGK